MTGKREEERAMREIDLNDDEQQLDDLVAAAVGGKPSILTRGGKKEAVILSYQDFVTITAEPRLGWLLANAPLKADDVPMRRPTAGFGGAIE